MKHSLSIFLLVVAGLWNAVLPATPPTSSVYPLHPSANGRYMLDASNAPFLIIGDAPHSILAKLNNSDAVTYLTDRGQRGFNALWIELLCDSYTFGYGTEGTPNYGRDVNGNNPFTATLAGGYYDLTTPNEAYWSHVDFIVQQAAANGLQCMFTPLDQGGWTQTSLVNGTTRCQQYGQFLGNRYKNYPNIIWNFGNDFQLWRTPLNDAVILAIADGLRSTDSNHLITIQLDYLVSESQDDPNWIPRINTNGVYTYYPTYAETLVAYNKPTIMPVLFLEENYEDENNAGELGTPKVLRRQEYWSMGGGALAGHMYGSYWTDRFANGWQSHLNTQAVTELGYFKNFFNSIHWYDLVPDQLHTFLTAGYGTFSGIGHVGDNDYATGLRTQDATLGVVYTPVSHTLTIAMSNFAGPVTARWYDPSADTFTNISGSPFPNSGIHNFTTPGNNSAGDPDWVLLLQAALGSPTPTPTATPTATFTPTPTATATATATATVTPTATPTATATATPSPAVTTNPATNVASVSATLNGSVNPRGSTTTVYFQWGTTTSYGHTTPVQTQTGNTSRPITANISGLSASHLYHFRIVATNGGGTSFGPDRTFTTLSATGRPVVTTNLATNVTTSSARLNGSLDPHGLTTTVYFQWGTTTSYGHTTPMRTQTGNTYRNVTANISGLTRNTTYHFRIVATNSAGTRRGSDRTFGTP